MTQLWTIGHSTRSLDVFLDCLRSQRIETLVDVRRFPTSRRSPQFGLEPLKKALFHAGVRYLYLGDELGGHRKEDPKSPHVGLARSGLQGYADWMGSELFRQGVQRLLSEAQTRRCAVMCAERPPSGCHRSLLGDYLTIVHAINVVDTIDPGVVKPHFLTPGVRRTPEGILYDVRPPATRVDAFES